MGEGQLLEWGTIIFIAVETWLPRLLAFVVFKTSDSELRRREYCMSFDNEGSSPSVPGFND